MKKSDLKTGMWVTTRNGSKYMVVKDVQTQLYGHQEVAFMGKEGFVVGSGFDEDLKMTSRSGSIVEESDIVEIRGFREGFVSANTYSGYNQPLLWRRKKVTTLTLEELIKKAGYEKGEVEIKVEH